MKISVKKIKSILTVDEIAHFFSQNASIREFTERLENQEKRQAEFETKFGPDVPVFAMQCQKCWTIARKLGIR